MQLRLPCRHHRRGAGLGGQRRRGRAELVPEPKDRVHVHFRQARHSAMPYATLHALTRACTPAQRPRSPRHRQGHVEPAVAAVSGARRQGQDHRSRRRGVCARGTRDRGGDGGGVCPARWHEDHQARGGWLGGGAHHLPARGRRTEGAECLLDAHKRSVGTLAAHPAADVVQPRGARGQRGRQHEACRARAARF
jgi:hypothetical protein